MDKIDRIYKLHHIFANHRTPLSQERLQELLECSRSTVLRDIKWLQDFMGAPLINQRNDGYLYDRTQGEFELPGLWLNASELQSILALNHLVENIQPGMLNDMSALDRRYRYYLNCALAL
jgi:predicted DNA-binding transcriptional regulator YafY